MRDQEGAGLKAEVLRQLDIVHAPGKHTQVQRDRGGSRPQTAASAPGKRTLAEAHGNDAPAFEHALADAQLHTRALDAAVASNDRPKMQQSMAALHTALGHVRNAVGGGSVGSGPDRLRATIDLLVRAQPLLTRATTPHGLVQRKENGSTQDGAEHAVSNASGSTGAALPDHLRGELESASGANMAGVRVHTGPESAAAASAVGAKAYTIGQDIHFGEGQYDPSGADGKHLIAHEAAHTVQQQGGTPVRQNKLEVSTPGDHHEVQADRFADSVVHGGPATSLSSGSSKIARDAISGNPGELKDAAGKPTTTHRDVTPADAANAPAIAAPVTTTRAANVKVVATEATPLHFNLPSCPNPDQIYVEGTAVSPAPTGYTAVTSFSGTADAPMVEQKGDSSLFIANMPTADDVQQGGIGDCYFQATLISITGRDPNLFKTIMTSDGKGGATVNLWRRQAHTLTIMEHLNPFGSPPKYDYIPVAVSVTGQLEVDLVGNRVHGAQLRAAPQAKSMDYFAKINGAALEVHRKDLFEVARWAPLVEKAYARFTEMYGQYGGARPNEAASKGSGYATIDGGFPNSVLPVFYGAKADAPSANPQEQYVNSMPTGNMLSANAAIVDQLCLIAGRPVTTAPGEKDAPLLEAFTDPNQQLGNLQKAIPLAIADADWANVTADKKTKVTAIQTALTAWAALPPDTAGVTAKATASAAVGNACVEAARTPNMADLAEVKSHLPPQFQFPKNDDAVPATAQGPLNFFGQYLNYEIAKGTLVPFNVTVTGHASTDEDLTAHPDLAKNRADHATTSIKSGFSVPANLARNNFNTVNAGKTGATAAAPWRRVDVDVAMQQGDNELLAAGRSAPVRTMMDLILNCRNMGTDHSGGQRNVYTSHAYAIQAVSFVDSTHAPVSLQTVQGAARSALFPKVDVDASIVTIRNPHHGNAPDRDGTNRDTGNGVPSGPTATGVFTVSLAGFFHNFNWVDSSVLPKS